MKIWNPAVLPEGWTLENLLAEHASTPYNSALANAFFRAGEIEAWGRGVQRIFEACRNAICPAPQVRYEPNDLWIEFPFAPEYMEAVRVGEAVPVETTQEKVVALLRANPATTRNAIAKSLGITADGVKYH